MCYFESATALPAYVPLPTFLLKSDLPPSAKLIYALLLSRTMLSQRSLWANEDGHIFVYYTLRELADDLGLSERSVTSMLRLLEEKGLLRRERQGCNRANRLFLLLPDDLPDRQEPAASDTQDLPIRSGSKRAASRKYASSPKAQYLPGSKTKEKKERISLPQGYGARTARRKENDSSQSKVWMLEYLTDIPRKA